MTNLIITPVYKSYEIVREMCEAIDKYTVNPYLHVLVDDDSDCGEFPVKSSPSRRIIVLKRDYTGIIHKNGGGQAMQLAFDYGHQAYCNEKLNSLPYDNLFLIEADVIVKEEWDKKMIEVKETLPEDWATLDCQSVDLEGKLTHPTTISPRIGFIREDLEHMKYCDFQCSLFNQEIFKSGIKFSDASSHFDIIWSGKITEATGKQHYRTMNVKVLHYFYQSRQYLNEIPRE